HVHMNTSTNAFIHHRLMSLVSQIEVVKSIPYTLKIKRLGCYIFPRLFSLETVIPFNSPDMRIEIGRKIHALNFNLHTIQISLMLTGWERENCLHVIHLCSLHSLFKSFTSPRHLIEDRDITILHIDFTDIKQSFIEKG